MTNYQYNDDNDGMGLEYLLWSVSDVKEAISSIKEVYFFLKEHCISYQNSLSVHDVNLTECN